MSGVFIAKSTVLLIVLLMALYQDIKEQKIKNFITLPATGIGLMLNYLEMGSTGMVFAFKGWLIPIIALFIFYCLNMMGAGDIKLFAAIGAIMGLPFITYSFIFTIYIGGFIALAILVKRNQFVLRISYLFSYFKTAIYCGRLNKYCEKGDKSSKFIFSTAIVPGTLVQLCITILGYQGVIIFK